MRIVGNRKRTRYVYKKGMKNDIENSKGTLKNSLSDPYVKAFRWAADRIKDEGIVALVINNSLGFRCFSPRIPKPNYQQMGYLLL